MDKNTKSRLLNEYRQLPRNERDKLAKLASRQRQQERYAPTHKVRRRTRENSDDEEYGGNDVQVRREPSLEDYIAQLLLEAESEQTAEIDGPVITGRATWIGLGRATVDVDGELLHCAVDPLRTIAPEGGPAVGDVVHIQPHGEGHRVVRVLKRRTFLARADPAVRYVTLVVAANIDVVVVTVSVVSPPLHPRLIDRYLVAIEHGGAQPVLAVNKIDLEPGQKSLSLLDPYRRLGIPVVACSANTGEGVEDLHRVISGKVCVFVGHSGVGKSSLVNAVFPAASAYTGELMEGYGRGAHTTTASSLYRLPDGTELIDTPGIREFGIADLNQEELRLYFPEFQRVGACKYRDCSHTHEPRCAVKEAVECGDVDQERFDTYLRLMEELSE